MIVNDTSHGSEGNIRPRDRLMDLDISNEERAVESVPITVEKEMVAPSLDGRTYLAVSNMDKDAAELTIHGNDPNRASANEEPIPAFPAPVDDTQDLFDDSEPNGPTAIENEPQLNGPLEEEFAPSLLAMNAKFDSAPVADISSEEEDDEKEKIGPHPCGIADDSSSPRRGPVKIFVDDEAEDEDDSDTEAADCIDDLMELKDMIAPECEERHIDKERRDELHRKWLEQQDAAETEYLLQRLKCGSGLGDAFRSYNKLETDEDGEELNDESEEESLPQKSGRVAKSGKVNIEKAKQIILQLFSDKEDIYLSDDDGTQRRHAQCLIRKEEQATLLSPTDDASSREVFGLIKKVNVASDNKRKPKSWSIFDTVLKRGNDDHPAKSSFLGRVPNHPLPSSHKKGSATVQSFIFQRKNSNSRSSMSISEDFSDTVSRDTRPTRNLTAKYSNSETKVRSQTRDAAPETLSKTSLLEILKRPSSQSQVCNKDTSIDLRKSLFASGVSTMPTKRNGRS